MENVSSFMFTSNMYPFFLDTIILYNYKPFFYCSRYSVPESETWRNPLLVFETWKKSTGTRGTFFTRYFISQKLHNFDMEHLCAKWYSNNLRLRILSHNIIPVCLAAFWRWQHKYVQPRRAGIAPFFHVVVGSMIFFYVINYKKLRKYTRMRIITFILNMNLIFGFFFYFRSSQKLQISLILFY